MSSSLNFSLLTSLRTQHYLSLPLPLSRSLVPTFNHNPTSNDNYFYYVPYLHHRQCIALRHVNNTIQLCTILDSYNPTTSIACSSLENWSINEYSTDTDTPSYSSSAPSSQRSPLSLTNYNNTRILVFIIDIDDLPTSTTSLYTYMPAFIKDNLFTPTDWSKLVAGQSPIQAFPTANASIVENPSLAVLYDPQWPISIQNMLALDKRIILCFGNKITNLNGYNTSNDANYIFPSNASVCSLTPTTITTQNASILLSDNVPVPAYACGHPSPNVYMTGTGFDTNTSSLFTPGSFGGLGNGVTALSWAFATLYESISAPFDSLTRQRTINCGFSPALLYSEKVDNLLSDLVWTWKMGYPTNDTEGDCAIMDKTDGRWMNTGCKSKYPVSCQTPDNPYNWTIIKSIATFADAKTACPIPYTFAVPRTPLENLALYEKFREDNEDTSKYLWINLNQIKRKYCWVVGENATCPYASNIDVVPAIIRSNLNTGLIILIIIGVFLYLKINRNIKSYKATKRRMEVRRKIRLLDVNGVPQWNYTIKMDHSIYI